MAPERSLRTTFSHSSGLVLTCVSSEGSSTRPAVFSRELWHVTQYCSKTAAGVAGREVCARIVNASTVRRKLARTTFLFIAMSRNILFAQRGTHEIFRRIVRLGISVGGNHNHVR